MEEIITKVLCGQCKNFNDFIEFCNCELGRTNEFKPDGGLTVCSYWEVEE